MNKIEGQLPYLPKEEYDFRIRELFGLIKDTYKTMDTFYIEILANKVQLNNISLSLRVIFDTLEELEDKDFVSSNRQFNEMKEFNKQMYEKMKQYEKDASDFRTFKKIVEDLDKREKEKKNKKYSGLEYG